MFLEIILFTFLGIAFGTLTGILPGLHPNTVFTITVSFSVILIQFPIYAVLAFIVSLAVTNTFVDMIPALLFGAPDPNAALAVLPGHKFLLEGRGYEALMLTVLGGVGVVILTLITFPLLLYFIPALYTTIHSFIHIILLMIVLWLILAEKGIKKLLALGVFILAGLFGVISLNALPSQAALFPALTGLFGFSTLITSLLTKTVIPKQRQWCEIGFNIKGIVIGWLSAMTVSILPGVGSAQASVIAARLFKAKTRDFLTAIGGINTANILFTFIVFFTLMKTRSGAAWALSQIVETLTIEGLMLMAVVGLISCLIAAVVTLKIGKLIVRKIGDINYNMFTIIIITILIVLIFIFTGPLGLFVSLVGTFIGLTTIFMKVKRSHLMGYLLLPTILHFSGLSAIFLHFLGI